MKKVLFVCLGNICRSPTAEGIFRKFVKNKKLDAKIIIDSAGTMGYHEGELPDKRMRVLASQRGYLLDSRARKFNPEFDFDNFDYIVTMDDENFNDVNRLDIYHSYKNKIFKMSDFVNDKNVKEIPDPYYGGENEFNYVIDLLEIGAKNLLNKIEDDIASACKKSN